MLPKIWVELPARLGVGTSHLNIAAASMPPNRSHLVNLDKL
jgi:hypothetical protein